ncbi:MAG TPA: Fur family transcriptional regulator [Candidatus Limnocylindrales bacterium]|nr:Fur family transcriptional regulator [Candidatus Limnocylindrales bacterium]
MERLEKFREFIRERGLKSTRQRDEIASWFFGHKGHLSADQIYREVKELHPGIGFSTVYRTMKLLVEAGLVSERHFSDAEALYENVVGHHDHCICTSCGKIIEFENERIEELQRSVAEKHGFLLKSHKMELYGLCQTCRVREP